jgi:hypothetical protein
MATRACVRHRRSRDMGAGGDDADLQLGGGVEDGDSSDEDL